MDNSEDFTSNPRIGSVSTIGDLVDVRLSRRGFLTGSAALAGVTLAGCETLPVVDNLTADTSSAFQFTEVTRGIDETHHVPEEFKTEIVIKWGDPLFADSPAFDPMAQSEAKQLRQFGYNNDYVGFIQLDPDANGRQRALLCVNHEYVSTPLMQPGVAAGYPGSMTKERCATEMAAHGGTVVEIVETETGWTPVIGSKYNRRITAHKTPMAITGPAAGAERMKTPEDPQGRTIAGTMNNCAGGITPWGTYLMAEENFNGNFLGEVPDGSPEAKNHARYGVPSGWYQWGRHFDRFDVSKVPNEPNRFGWVVEVDPFDPNSTPKKRTALGRFKHEGAENVIAKDGRLVIYMGDDQRFDYLYKFVSEGRVSDDRAANMDLLDKGTLYVARFDADGSMEWLPLIYGTGPLTEANGFNSQADVLIDTRLAADALGATPMDRPEDVEPDARTGKVYVMLTNNHKRDAGDVNAANPRGPNLNGHIIEITEPDADFTSTKSNWDILIQCGDPEDASVGAVWNPLTSENGWFGSPDNCTIDPKGRLWVSTDGNQKTGSTDGVWAIETTGARRGTSKAFFRAPIGAEVCGPKFAKDGKTFFLAVQHPGDGDDATFEAPTTRWPDFKEGVPPRPAVVAIRRKDGSEV